MASHTVFDTYELLEAILAYLPFADIISTRAVCQSWKAIFDSSLQLRQATFRTPLDGRALPLDVEDTNGYYTAANGFTMPPSHAGKIPHILPLFTNSNRKAPYCYYEFTKADVETSRLNGIVWMNMTRALGTPPFSPGIWSEMFVTQPPITAALLFPNVPAWSSNAISVRNVNGITLGHFAKVLETALRQYEKQVGAF